jgi:hypothetical protein
VEAIGDEMVVLDPSSGVVHHLSGLTAEALQAVAGGDPSWPSTPDRLRPAMEELVAAKIVVDGWSRRKVLIAGGLGIAGASVSSLILPQPAAALTACEQSSLPALFDNPGDFEFIVPHGVTAIRVHVWGAGGGGAARGATGLLAGQGGGGGGYSSSVLEVSPCETYALTVGAGGQGSVGATPASDGGDSNFDGQVVALAGLAGGPMLAGAGGDLGDGDITFRGGRGGGIGAGGNSGGGGGGSGGAAGNGGNGAPLVGGAAGAGSPSGAVGGAGGPNGVNGSNGNAPGAGGGGHGRNATISGNGADGRILIEAP